MSKPKAELTPRVACARIVKLLESLPLGDRARTLRAAEAMLALDVEVGDDLAAGHQ